MFSDHSFNPLDGGRSTGLRRFNTNAQFVACNLRGDEHVNLTRWPSRQGLDHRGFLDDRALIPRHMALGDGDYFLKCIRPTRHNRRVDRAASSTEEQAT
jgi:hypothetical protein